MHQNPLWVFFTIFIFINMLVVHDIIVGSWYVYITHLHSFYIPFLAPLDPLHISKHCILCFLLSVLFALQIMYALGFTYKRKRIMWNLNLCVWLFHFNLVVSRCIYFPINDSMLSFLMVEQNFVMCKCHRILYMGCLSLLPHNIKRPWSP